MRILALETSGRLGSIALGESTGGDLNIVAARELPAGERSARSLLPCVQQSLCEHGWQPRDLELIAVTAGPGSFTGLRIGVVAAKTLAYALGAKLVGVHTLAAMAEHVQSLGGDPRPPRLWTVLDAQRQELFASRFELGRAIVDQAEPATEVLPIDEWLARLAPHDGVAGPPLVKLRDRLPAGVQVVPESQWQPSAAATGRLAFALFERGATVPPLELVPHYFRKSAAEEKQATQRAAPSR